MIKQTSQSSLNKQTFSIWLVLDLKRQVFFHDELPELISLKFQSFHLVLSQLLFLLTVSGLAIGIEQQICSSWISNCCSFLKSCLARVLDLSSRVKFKQFGDKTVEHRPHFSFNTGSKRFPTDLKRRKVGYTQSSGYASSRLTHKCPSRQLIIPGKIPSLLQTECEKQTKETKMSTSPSVKLILFISMTILYLTW